MSSPVNSFVSPAFQVQPTPVSYSVSPFICKSSHSGQSSPVQSSPIQSVNPFDMTTSSGEAEIEIDNGEADIATDDTIEGNHIHSTIVERKYIIRELKAKIKSYN